MKACKYLILTVLFSLNVKKIISRPWVVTVPRRFTIVPPRRMMEGGDGRVTSAYCYSTRDFR